MFIMQENRNFYKHACQNMVPRKCQIAQTKTVVTNCNWYILGNVPKLGAVSFNIINKESSFKTFEVSTININILFLFTLICVFNVHKKTWD